MTFSSQLLFSVAQMLKKKTHSHHVIRPFQLTELFTYFLISLPIKHYNFVHSNQFVNAHKNKRRDSWHKPIISNHSPMEALPPLT